MATVKFSDEMPKPTSIKGTDRFLISDGVTGEAKAPDFNQAKEYLNITGIEMEPLVGGTTSGTALVVPNGPAGEQRTAEVSSGKWYDFGSGPVQASADRRWKSYWSGTSWILKDLGALPQVIADGKVIENDTKAVAGGEVFEKTLVKDKYLYYNKFNPTNVISGKYIQNSSGNLTNDSSAYVITEIMAAEEGQRVYLKNWDRNVSFAVRFVDSLGNPLKPLHSDGTPFSVYAETFSDYIIAPENAVGVQATVKFNNYGNQANLIINNNGIDSEVIKGEFILSNAEVKKGDINPLSGDTAYKILVKKSEIIVGENLYDYTKDIPNVYINASGNLINEGSPYAISAPIDVRHLDKVVIQNRLGNPGYRFLSENGSQMKALDKNGVEFTNYFGPLNGEYYKPVGAVSFQFTTMFGNVTSRNITVVNSDGYLKKQINRDLIPVDTIGKVWASKSSNNVSINGLNDNGAMVSTNIVFRSGANTQSNPNFNILNDYVGGVLFKDSSDDVAPVNLFNNSYIGANHGWNYARTIGLAGHGKTVADIGSIYTDSLNREYVIVNIIDASNFILCSRNLAVDGYSYTFPATTEPLTYKSNGANTSNIPSGYTATPLNNLYNFIKLNVSKLVVDGKEVTADGNVYGNSIQVVEDYDVFDLDSVLAQLIANRPSGGYTVAPNLNSFNATKFFNHSLVYEWKKAGKCVVSHSFLVYKKLSFNFHGFVQASAIANGSAKIYIPKALPFGGVDYRLAPTYATPADPVHITKAGYWEYPDNSPDRVMNFLTGNYGIHLGYINDLADSVNRESLVDDAIFLNTSKKLYPKGIDKVQVLEPGASYSVVAFRNIIDITNVGSVRTSLDFVRADNALYVFADYHKQGLDTIELPDDFLGKNIAVIENRKAVLYGKISTKVMRINSTANDYGFIVFKVK